MDKEVDPRRIFISYGHDEHAALAERLKKDLQARGHEVWFDLDRLLPGHDWENYIEEGLDWVSELPGEGRVVLLMTPHSVRRPDGYCLNEIARSLARKLSLIPVMVAWCEPPLSICRIQWLDMQDCVPVQKRQRRYETKFKRLVEALEQEGLDFEGADSELLDLLEPLPFDADIAQHIFRFTGRQWIFDRIDRWLADHAASRILWITGKPGAGKTAIAAWLCYHRPEVAAFHLCRYGHAQKADPRKCVLSIAYQLSTQIPEYQARLNTLDLETTSLDSNAKTLFDNLILQPLSGVSPQPDQMSIILIDGLDEATEGGRNELAAFIASEFPKSPDWLRLIITSRPDPEVIHPLQGLTPFALDTTSSENEQDLRAFLIRELKPYAGGADLQPSTIDSIIARSEGIFLYVEWIRQELALGRLSLTQLDEFPQGLGGVYAQFFERQFADLGTYQSRIRPALEIIAAAQEQLEVGMIATLLEWNEYEQVEFARALGSLFTIREGKIEPFHRSVIDWLTDVAKAGPYLVSVKAGHRWLAQLGWQQYQKGVDDLPLYMLAHLPTHLFMAALGNELETLLTDLFFIEANCQAGIVYRLVATYERLGAGQGKPGTPIKTAWLYQNKYGVRCPACLGWNEISKEELDRVVRCPACEQQLKLNAFSIEAEWRPSVLQKTTTKHEQPAVSQLSDDVHEFAQFTRNQAHLLREVPALTFQQAANQPDVAAPARVASELWDQGSAWRPWLQWVNKPQHPDPCLMTRSVSYAISCAYSPDGRRIVFGTLDRTLSMWDMARDREFRTAEEGLELISSERPILLLVDAATGAMLAKLAGHSERSPEGMRGMPAVVSACAYSPDGRRIVSGAEDSTLRIWNAETGQELMTLKGHSHWVHACAYSPDGRRVVSGSLDGTLKVWDAETGQELLTLNGHSAAINACDYSPDGSRIVSGAADSSLKVWNAENGQELITMAGHSGPVNACAYSPDGYRIVSGADDSSLKVWDAETGEELTTLNGHSDGVFACAYSPDGGRIVSGSNDNSLKLWDPKTSQELFTLEGHSDRIKDCAFSPDGRCVVSVTFGEIKVWDVKASVKSAGAEVNVQLDEELAHEVSTLQAAEVHSEFLKNKAQSPDGSRSVAEADDPQLKLCDARTGKELTTLKGHRETVLACAYSPDGRRIVSASVDETLKVWDAEQGKELATLSGHSDMVLTCAYAPDGCRIVSGSTDSALKVWDAKAFRETLTLSGNQYMVPTCAYSPDGRRILSVSFDPSVGWSGSGTTLRLWDGRTGAEMVTFEADFDSLDVCAFSPDGRRVISGSEDGRLRVWDAESGEELATFLMNRGIALIAQTGSGRMLLTIDESERRDLLRLVGAETDPPIVTAVYLYRFSKHRWDSQPSVKCKSCGERFPPPTTILNTIHDIAQRANLAPDQSPCAELSAEAWDEPALLSECSHCRQPLRFNPFIADNPDRTINKPRRWKFQK